MKTQVVSFGGGAESRVISGVIEADTSSVLSFPIGGTVAEIRVDIGDMVAIGQILASLDAKKFEVDVSAAEAQQASSQADLLYASEQVRRLSELYDQGIVAKVELDNARTAMASAQGNLKLAQTKLAKARDDLRRAVLVAPFSGKVSARQINPFQEVAPGEPCITIVGTQELKARTLVPENVSRNLRLGQRVTVKLTYIPEKQIPARISEIGAVAEAGAAVPVRAALDREVIKGMQILLGSAVLVSFPVTAAEVPPVVLIPLSALAMNAMPMLAAAGGTGGRAPLFLFDPEQGRLERRLVEVAGLQGNMLAVSGGLQPGEEVVVAGASFLEDGMQVRRWDPKPPEETTAFTTINQLPSEQ